MFVYDISYASDKGAYRKAARADTIASYKEYLEKYPEGRFAPDAQSRLGELSYQAAETIGSTLAFERYLRESVDGRFSEQARLKIAENELSEAQEANTVRSWERYIEKYAVGDYLAIAEATVRDLYLQRAKTAQSVRALDAFLDRYPGDEQEAWAERARQALLGREEQKWANTVADGSVDAYLRFIMVYPYGKLTEEAFAFLKGQGYLIADSGIFQILEAKLTKEHEANRAGLKTKYSALQGQVLAVLVMALVSNAEDFRMDARILEKVQAINPGSGEALPVGELCPSGKHE